jgi:hypothetical protein
MSEPITNEMTGVQPSPSIESITPTGPAMPVFEWANSPYGCDLLLIVLIDRSGWRERSIRAWVDLAWDGAELQARVQQVLPGWIISEVIVLQEAI